MSDTEDEYEQMLVKALQLALEEDQEERDKKHKQIECRKKLVPKSRRSIPGESDIEVQRNKGSASPKAIGPKSIQRTRKSKTRRRVVAMQAIKSRPTRTLAARMTTSTTRLTTQGDEKQDQPISTPDNKSTTRPIFTTPFAVPAGNLQTLKLLGTAKTEMADVPGGMFPEQKGT
jgi:hypothetical protein